MEKSNPWEVDNHIDSPVESSITRFEDNFTTSVISDKLPDSAEYLATLEKKLARIKNGKGNQKTEGKELIKSLEERSDSCMYRLIAGDSYSVTEQDVLLDTPARQVLSSKWLRPEQAITVGELVQLVQADYLATQHSTTDTTDCGDAAQAYLTLECCSFRLKMPDQFWGRRSFCLVTGASQGIGRSFAVEFAHRFAPGSHLVLLARSLAGLEQTKTLIATTSPHVSVQLHSVDLSKPDVAVFKSILNHKDLKDKSFELTMLVNNAGSIGHADQLAADMDDSEEWNRYLSLNLYHVTALTAEFLRRFSLGHRCVINVTSLCAIQPFKSMGYYCVGKASREMYFKCLAAENEGLDVLSYSPGPVDTDMVSEIINTIQDDETKKSFVTMKDSKTLVTLEQTTQKLVALLESRKYKSGDRFDYYDPL